MQEESEFILVMCVVHHWNQLPNHVKIVHETNWFGFCKTNLSKKKVSVSFLFVFMVGLVLNFV